MQSGRTVIFRLISTNGHQCVAKRKYRNHIIYMMCAMCICLSSPFPHCLLLFVPPSLSLFYSAALFVCVSLLFAANINMYYMYIKILNRKLKCKASHFVCMRFATYTLYRIRDTQCIKYIYISRHRPHLYYIRTDKSLLNFCIGHWSNLVFALWAGSSLFFPRPTQFQQFHFIQSAICRIRSNNQPWIRHISINEMNRESVVVAVVEFLFFVTVICAHFVWKRVSFSNTFCNAFTKNLFIDTHQT